MHASYRTLVLVFMLSVKALCNVDKPVPRRDPAIWQGQSLSNRGWWQLKACPSHPEDSVGRRRGRVGPFYLDSHVGFWEAAPRWCSPLAWDPDRLESELSFTRVTTRRKSDPWQTHFLICKMEMRITPVSVDCFDDSVRQCLWRT